MKSFSDFNKSAIRKDGHQSWCRVCTKNMNNSLYLNGKRAKQVRESVVRNIKRNADYVKSYLAKHPCVDCGEMDIIVLEFDHVREVKIGNICDMVRAGSRIKKIQEEIDKCDVRCANDHRRRTVERRNFILTIEA
jgi:hypothetical protein